MTGRATITFSQPGVHSPVYVVTSLSSPPWQPLELNPTDDKTAQGDVVFSRQFDNVPEGQYQYKIRLGDDHWIVDESMETATDDAGNRNNVIHAKAETQSNRISSPSEATATKEPPASTDSTGSLNKDTEGSEQAEGNPASAVTDTRKDNALKAANDGQLPTVPVPFVVVEKVFDKEQPDYGGMHTESLSKDTSKRAADADPDFEEVKAEPPDESQPQEARPVPLVVVEKTDDTSSHGDDFGEKATSAQKVAHDLRGSDAEPDRIVVKKDRYHHVEPGTPEEQAAPLFSHESLGSGSRPGSPESPMETIEEESSKSSPDRTEFGHVTNTPSEKHEPAGQEEGGHAPVLPQKPLPPHYDTIEPENTPRWLSLETGSSGEAAGVFCSSPLRSHEASYSVNSNAPNEGELDQAPLLPHEMDAPRHSSFRRIGILPDHVAGDYDDGMFESMRAPTFSHEDMHSGDDDSEAPLLPHERNSSFQRTPSSEHSPTEFAMANDDNRRLSHDLSSPGRHFSLGRPPTFRTRTNSSSLPHNLPRSDEEDENLHDPSLEPFPTSREKILEQVVTIGNTLPEDETVGTSLHSPHFTNMSQACSSVDLAPVRSYSSLQSVVEETAEDEAGDSGLPSPTFSTSNKDKVIEHVSQLGEPSSLSESHAIPKLTDKGLRILEENSDAASDVPIHEPEKKEKVKIKDENDSKEPSRAAPANTGKAFEPPTPPLTPEKKSMPQQSEDPQPVLSPEGLSKPTKPDISSSSASHEDSDGKDAKSFRNIFGTVFGPLGRLLTVCFGNSSKKQAAGTVFVVGIAIAAYYYVYGLPR